MTDIEALVVEWCDARQAIIGATDWIKLPPETRHAQLDRLANAERALMARARTIQS